MGIINTNEPDSTITHNLPVGLYYYYIDRAKLEEATYLGYVPTIESITFNPFIEEHELDLYKASFDTDRFGSPTGNIPNCYRIATNNLIDKLLERIKILPNKNDIKEYDEVKLFLYPYTYYLITDYYNNPLLIKPQLISSATGEMVIKVLTAPISQEGKYNIYVENYKYDNEGNLEGNINNSALMLPVASSAYSQFLATSSTSFTQGNINAMLENDVTLKQGLRSNQLSQMQNLVGSGIGLVGNVLSGNLIGALNTGATGMFNAMNLYNQSEFMRENASLKENAISSMTNAKITDMLNTPKALKTCGNDTVFNLANSRQKIDVIKYTVRPEVEYRLKDYFKRYGYYQNNYLPIRLNGRKYYTFIKTSVCNIIGEKIPHNDLNEIKEIFNSGITFWNMKNNPIVGDYSYYNEEV